MYRQLQYFVAVVETGSFSEAAERCHISQSAVSQQLRALEDELQIALLNRHGRRFEVTPAGQYLYRRGKRQLAEMDSLVREVRRIGRGEHRRLRIGVLTGFSGRIVQSAVHDFAATHPNVRATVVTGAHEALFRQVVGGQLDLVVSDQRRALSDQFVNEELGDQPLCALVRQELAPNAVPLALEALGDVMCILVAAPEQRENETDFWRDVAGVRSDILFAEDMDAARLNAAAGVGWLPCDADMPCGPGLALAPLTRGGRPLTRKMFAFWPEASDSSLQWEFSEMLAAHFK